jgi:hypothetical protein
LKGGLKQARLTRPKHAVKGEWGAVCRRTERAMRQTYFRKAADGSGAVDGIKLCRSPAAGEAVSGGQIRP